MYLNTSGTGGDVFISRVHDGNVIHMRQSESVIIDRDPTSGELFRGGE